jgi:protoheme IX farnesyltransferase
LGLAWAYSCLMNTALALLRASHFPQTLAMTVFLAAAAAVTAVQGWQLVLFILAVLSGQLSVGWMNDFVDAKLDQSVSRSEKPVVTGALSQSSLKVPIAIALVLTIPLSILAAGWIGGLAHVAAVASAHVYNFYLSRTIWSWLPYVVSFALLPLFVAQAASNSLFPELPMIVLFALVGFIAHLLNALPDIEIDRQAGKGGLAVSLGRKRTLAFVVVFSVAALAVLLYMLLGSA